MFIDGNSSTMSDGSELEWTLLDPQHEVPIRITCSCSGGDDTIVVPSCDNLLEGEKLIIHEDNCTFELCSSVPNTWLNLDKKTYTTGHHPHNHHHTSTDSSSAPSVGRLCITNFRILFDMYEEPLNVCLGRRPSSNIIPLSCIGSVTYASPNNSSNNPDCFNNSPTHNNSVKGGIQLFCKDWRLINIWIPNLSSCTDVSSIHLFQIINNK
eukprot:TRINITY_DN5806_c0_g1_i1.p1 TRINITY_DN5806_c0_g1~~TRINITY_DN5806_c0_g1_i1.p1  ORF type:complete len:210 (-),score=35.53 TRINITY_DN5806_c0_g1_i1:7-636(-)